MSHDERAPAQPDLRIAPAATRAFALSRALWRSERWAGQISAQLQPTESAQFGARLIARLTSARPVGVWGDALVRRFTRRDRAANQAALPVSPYVPPLRQLSAARQGAAAWQGQSGPSMDASALLSDLSILNWGQPPDSE